MHALKPHQSDADVATSPAAWLFPVKLRGEAVEPSGDTGRSKPCLPSAGRASTAAGACPQARRARESAQNASILPPFAAAFAVRFGGPTSAEQCSKNIADAQTLIDRISARMEFLGARMAQGWGAMVQALLEDARFMLTEARHNHEHARAPFDHARAFAKADIALGHARAAEIICARLDQDSRSGSARG
jgi:hypothetical protein